MQLQEFIAFVESVRDELETYPVSNNWEYKEYKNAFIATCGSCNSARLLKATSYQIHLWKDKNVALLLKLSAGSRVKLKSFPMLKTIK